MFFSRNLVAAVALCMSLALHADAHAAIAPALGVQGAPVRKDAQRPSTAKPCGNTNIAQTIDSSTAAAADASGVFAATITNFNAGVDGSTLVTAKVDATGTGKSFVDAQVIQNGVKAPTSTGSVPLSVQLPAGTTCTGGATGNKCLVSFTTAGRFGNCVVVSQGAAAAAGAGNAATNGTAAAGTGNSTAAAGTGNTATTGTGKGKGRKGQKGAAGAAQGTAAAAGTNAAATDAAAATGTDVASTGTDTTAAAADSAAATAAATDSAAATATDSTAATATSAAATTGKKHHHKGNKQAGQAAQGTAAATDSTAAAATDSAAAAATDSAAATATSAAATTGKKGKQAAAAQGTDNAALVDRVRRFVQAQRQNRAAGTRRARIARRAAEGPAVEVLA